MTAIRVVTQHPVVRVTDDAGTSIRVASSPASVVKVSDIGIQGPTGSRLVELVYMVAGDVPPNRTILGYLASDDIDFLPAAAVAVCATGNNVDITFTIMTLTNTVVGTIAFLMGQTVGTVTLNPLSLTQGEGLKFVHPATAAGMTDLVVTLPANRT